MDLLVEGAVVVELKSVEKLAPVHSKQLLTYLRLLDLPVGLLLNFGAATLKDGLHRVVNHLDPSRIPTPPREPVLRSSVLSRGPERYPAPWRKLSLHPQPDRIKQLDQVVTDPVDAGLVKLTVHPE